MPVETYCAFPNAGANTPAVLTALVAASEPAVIGEHVLRQRDSVAQTTIRQLTRVRERSHRGWAMTETLALSHEHASSGPRG